MTKTTKGCRDLFVYRSGRCGWRFGKGARMQYGDFVGREKDVVVVYMGAQRYECDVLEYERHDEQYSWNNERPLIGIYRVRIRLDGPPMTLVH